MVPSTNKGENYLYIHEGEMTPCTRKRVSLLWIEHCPWQRDEKISKPGGPQIYPGSMAGECLQA